MMKMKRREGKDAQPHDGIEMKKDDEISASQFKALFRVAFLSSSWQVYYFLPCTAYSEQCTL